MLSRSVHDVLLRSGKSDYNSRIMLYFIKPQGYPCKWYIGFSFFVFVLCQIIAIVVVLTAFIELTPVMEIVATTIVLTGIAVKDETIDS